MWSAVGSEKVSFTQKDILFLVHIKGKQYQILQIRFRNLKPFRPMTLLLSLMFSKLHCASVSLDVVKYRQEAELKRDQRLTPLIPPDYSHAQN